MSWLKIAIVTTFIGGCHHGEPTGSTVAVRSIGKAPVSIIHQPARLTGVDVGKDNSQGQPVRVRCETCHALRPEAPLPRSMDALQEFHVGMKLTHGAVECSSCHAQGQVPRLRLASGEVIQTRDALRLCSQCHGPQFRDYQHGAHGGMTGYWDTTRGPRVRNHCVDCHDPHSPQIAPVIPVPRPRDRFFTTKGHQ